MKKIIFNLKSVAFVSLLLISCSNKSSSIESDAKKYAEIMCEAQQLAEKAQAGDMSYLEESAKLGEEASELFKEMQVKYKDGADYQKFSEVYEKTLADCQ